MLDIVVVGGGPVGSRVAWKMAGLGYRVAVLEKRAGTGEKLSCTGIISRECVTGFSIPQEVILREVKSARLFSPSGKQVRIYRPEAQAYIVDRRSFDRSMANKAVSRGAEYRFNSRANNIIVKNDGVTVEAEERGKVRLFRAKAAVLATGFNAPIVKRLGLGQTPYCAAGAQVEVGSFGLDEVEIYFNRKLAPGFFAWTVPSAEGRCLVGLMSRQSPGLRLRNWITRLEAQGSIVPGEYKIRYGGIPLKPLGKTYGERLLVVGDAAGQVKPTTGGGIYFGMLCADIAAGNLDEALQDNDLSLKRLSQYERDWRRKLGRELKAEYFARRLFQHLSDKQIDRLFTSLNSNGIVESLLENDSLSFDWHGSSILKLLRLSILSQASRMLRLPLVLARR